MNIKSGLATILLALTSGVFLAGCVAPDANSYYYTIERGYCKSNLFSEFDRDLDITFDWKYETLWLDWNQYKADDFDGYYIMRDESETCPYYYSGSNYYQYIYYHDHNYFKDENVQAGKTYYYRVCVKQKDKDVLCGDVKKVVMKSQN